MPSHDRIQRDATHGDEVTGLDPIRRLIAGRERPRYPSGFSALFPARPLRRALARAVENLQRVRPSPFLNGAVVQRWLEHFSPVLLSVDRLEPATPVENREAAVFFRIDNLTGQELTGEVHGTISPQGDCHVEGCDEPYATTSWKVSKLAPGAHATGILTFTAPQANPGNQLEIAFVQGREGAVPELHPFHVRPPDAADAVSFDVAARMRAGIDEIECVHPRSRDQDTLVSTIVFGGVQDSAWKGHVGAGDTVQSSLLTSRGFVDLVPGSTDDPQLAYLLVNNGDVRSDSDASALAAGLIALFFDPVEGLINAVGFTETGEGVGQGGGVALSPDFALLLFLGWMFLGTDCNGPVAAANHSIAPLVGRTLFSDHYATTTSHRGAPAPDLCGLRSYYKVTWGITRERLGDDEARIVPQAARVRPGGSLQFQVAPAGTQLEGTDAWKVEGGGTNGTIADGLYTAPSTVPDGRYVSISVTVAGQIGRPGTIAATVYLDPTA